MEFVADLTATLAHHGLPVPAPLSAKEGATKGTSIVRLAGKPALLVPKAPGCPPLQASIQQCHAIGRALAKIHRVTSALPIAHASHKSLAWVADTGRRLLPHLPADSRQPLETALAALDAFASTHEDLPQGIIHGDLFRDNSLFEGERLTAIIDFFSAGDGYLLFDLAVTANDWCIESLDNADPAKLTALLAGYCEVRPLTSQERQCWGEMLAIAALRFWVSRLADRCFPTSYRISPSTKDPAPYAKLWNLHITRPQVLDFTPQ
jgi:homoserine kinase type II